MVMKVMLMGVIHLENTSISELMGFQAWPMLPKAVKRDYSTQNIYFRKKSQASAFYTSSVASILELLGSLQGE